MQYHVGSRSIYCVITCHFQCACLITQFHTSNAVQNSALNTQCLHLRTTKSPLWLVQCKYGIMSKHDAYYKLVVIITNSEPLTETPTCVAKLHTLVMLNWLQNHNQRRKDRIGTRHLFRLAVAISSLLKSQLLNAYNYCANLPDARFCGRKWLWEDGLMLAARYSQLKAINMSVWQLALL